MVYHWGVGEGWEEEPRSLPCQPSPLLFCQNRQSNLPPKGRLGKAWFLNCIYHANLTTTTN